MRILQVNLYDRGGGAEKIATDLAACSRARGHRVKFAVGHKRSDDPNVWKIPRPRWWRYWDEQTKSLIDRGVGGLPRLTRILATLGDLPNLIDERRGREPFHFPGSRRLLKFAARPPDIVHAHNLHGGYFDLRFLPELSNRVPLVMTLHDAWLLSGHCAHSFDCERWLTGCGQCPDLTIYPEIRRDATRGNFARKRDIYRRSRLHIATPSQWLMDKVTRSMLADGIAEARVIPNGIDLSVFQRGNKAEARAALGIPRDATVLLTTAFLFRTNQWKDFETLRVAVERLPHEVTLLALGEAGPSERLGKAEVRMVPFETDPALVARYYQAADLYVHAAKADTFPTTVLEALACGTPVVASAVGGIPEQIMDGVTGLLVPPGNPTALSEAIESLLRDPVRRARMAEAAAAAGDAFGLERMTDAYLAWYDELLTK